MWLSVRIKRKRFVFNCTRLFYFKDKPTIPLRHWSENMKKHVPVKKLICKEIFTEVEIIKAFMDIKENGENVYKIERAIRSCSTK